MRRPLLLFFAFAFLIAPAFAQAENSVAAEATVTEQTPPPTGEPETPVLPKAPEYQDMPQVELRILDKVRAESRTYLLNVGRTVAYNNLRIRPRSCRKSSPLDDPENASFMQIWEVKPDKSSAWVFSGWMFASSPSLSAMDHPVYDVTVLDCKDPNAKPTETVPEEKTDETQSEDTSSDEAPIDTEDSSTKETSERESAPSSAE